MQTLLNSVAWREDLEAFSNKYHLRTTWIAIIFDPIFGITDFLNIPHAWHRLLLLRFSVSLLCLMAVFIWRKYRFSSKILVAVPFVLISLQNAYTYSVIEVSQFTGHSLNYMALFIGAGMFIIWNWYYSVFIIFISAIANVIFFNMNHELDLEHALVNGGLLLIVVSLFMFLLIETRRRLTIDLLKSKKALLITNEALKEQKKIVEEKNRDITDSINYAKRIQTAILPLQEKLQKALPQHFVLFKPKDIVSGDFYWFAEKEDKHILVAIDCTGHGVPGAFMSMIGDSILNNIIHDKEVHRPSLILNEMNQGVRLALQQDTTQNKDGMDLSLVVIDYKQQELIFAGAKNPIWYFQNDEMYEIAGDKHGIGGGNTLAGFSYKEHVIPLTDSQGSYLPTTFYLFSDGYQDQFGGKAGKKFMVGQLRRTIKSIATLDMTTQKNTLETTLENWKSECNEPQTDDVLVIGVRL